MKITTLFHRHTESTENAEIRTEWDRRRAMAIGASELAEIDAIFSASKAFFALPADHKEAIALGGLAHTKAPRIKRILEAISAPGGAPDLGVLEGMTDAEAQDYLVGLPGVGPKTAACVLLFSLGRPVMPVDTHVHRLARRLGIIDAKTTADQAHPLLTELAGADDPEQVYAAHVDFVRHGRRICHARRPACGECPLAGFCPSAGLA